MQFPVQQGTRVAGQFWVLQYTVLLCAVYRWHVFLRCIVWVPPPHVAEHGVVFLHASQLLQHCVLQLRDS